MNPQLKITAEMSHAKASLATSQMLLAEAEAVLAWGLFLRNETACELRDIQKLLDRSHSLIDQSLELLHGVIECLVKHQSISFARSFNLAGLVDVSTYEPAAYFGTTPGAVVRPADAKLVLITLGNVGAQ